MGDLNAQKPITVNEKEELKMKSMPTRTFLTTLIAFIVVAFSTSYAYADSKASDKVDLMRGFNGKIELDTRNSKPDWKPFLPKKAPKDAPNILFILAMDAMDKARRISPMGTCEKFIGPAKTIASPTCQDSIPSTLLVFLLRSGKN